MAEQNKTIFGKILRGEIPSDQVWQDQHCIAFRDVNAVAPTHILIIPRDYIPTLNDLKEDHQSLIGHMVLVAAKIAAQEGIAEDGYRLVINCNAAGGQSVYHLHMHLIGGRGMSWPPG